MNGKRSDDLHRFWLLTLGITTLGLLYLLKPILTPFLFAAILAYIGNPIVSRLAGKKIPRVLATLTVMSLLFGAIIIAGFIIFPLTVKEITLFVQNLPNYEAWAKANILPWMKEHLGVEPDLDLAQLRDFALQSLQSKEHLGLLLPSLKSGSLALMKFFTNLLLVPVVLFYLLRDWGILLENIDAAIPRRWHDEVLTLARGIDDVLGEFLRGQLSVMLLLGIFYALGLTWIAHLDYALPVGLIAGLLAFIPYLGASVGLIVATLTGIIQFHSTQALLPILITFAIGQTLEGYLLVPWLVGERIGLHPVAVIFSMLAFGEIFGFFGILLALPLSAALLVGLRMMNTKYLNSSLYKSE